MDKPNGKPVRPTPKAFEQGDWFDWRDSEELEHKTPEDAIVEWVDLACPEDIEIPKWLASQTLPLRVTAYAPLEIPWHWVEVVSAGMITYLEEAFGEEWGSPHADEVFSKEVKSDLMEKLAFLLQDPLERANIWAAKSFAVREYAPAEIEQITREACPEWFDDEEQRND